MITKRATPAASNRNANSRGTPDAALHFEQLESKQLMTWIGTWDTSLYKDAGFRQSLVSALSDNKVTRTEYINVIKSTFDLNRIDSVEIQDIKNLSTKIRTVYLGSTMSIDPGFTAGGLSALSSLTNYMFDTNMNMGNELKVNARAADLNRLIDKYFLGKDLPVLDEYALSFGVSYKQVSGQLFVNGVSSDDICQGNVGDCYLLAAFSAIADKDPASITDAICSNGDGTYTVRFFAQQGTTKVQHYVVVDAMLPVRNTGFSFYADFGGTYFKYKFNDPNNELWVSLMEKAYVQWNQTGLTLQGNRLNTYEAISGGQSAVVFNQLYVDTPVRISTNTISEDVLFAAANSKTPMTVNMYLYSDRTGLHAFSLVGYHAPTKKWIFDNPWGFGDKRVTIQELNTMTTGYAIAPQRKVIIVIPPITIPPRPVGGGAVVASRTSDAGMAHVFGDWGPADGGKQWRQQVSMRSRGFVRG